jgi:hypothetical protein
MTSYLQEVNPSTSLRVLPRELMGEDNNMLSREAAKSGAADPVVGRSARLHGSIAEAEIRETLGTNASRIRGVVSEKLHRKKGGGEMELSRDNHLRQDV